jgi:protein-L-isoaspartate(D-aspartate) O-methyltransferase
MHESGFDRQRVKLVEHALRSRGIRDPVLSAMRDVPREEFVPPQMRELAYRDSALPIECGQTISQPYIVALMIQSLNVSPDDRVLEIGTGSGYAAAVMSRIARDVFTIERLDELAFSAKERLHRLGFDSVHVAQGDGTLGWPEEAPFDAITVTASAPHVPPALLRQLSIGGRLVIPVGDSSQQLIRFVRQGPDEYEQRDLGGVLFVPLIGQEGWSSHHDNDRHRLSRITSETDQEPKHRITSIDQ